MHCTQNFLAYWCSHVYGGRKQALALLHNSEHCQLIKQMRGHRGVATDNQNVITSLTIAYSCSVDGSFKMPDQGGAAYVLKHDYILVQYGLKYYSALSPFHMEASALLMGMRAAAASGIDSCTFLTDSEQLVRVLNNKQTPVNENLLVRTEITGIYSILSQHSCYKCIHIQREGNKLAHDIANLARTKMFRDHVGFTYPLFLNV
ncbi:Reverse transcriptase-like protein [Carex littledalei]|uniref:Reverse transcriptase-like protein n=1 Tax=Carex littledalei TaxID=544730 RepID=A0A833RZK1_9POAL|nr:Reverse transcriptase-like protein [Carex littledalei]